MNKLLYTNKQQQKKQNTHKQTKRYIVYACVCSDKHSHHFIDNIKQFP